MLNIITRESIARYAKVIYGKDNAFLSDSQSLVKKTIRMKDGQNYQVKQKDYPINSPVWKLNNHLSRSETEQAISRIRPFDVNHESGKQTVYILTSQVLDITVDELIPSNDFLLTSPRKTGSNIRDGILAVLERNGGIIRWKPSEIASELNIDPRQLYEAKKQLWFSDNVDSSLRIVTYVRIDKKSSKKLIKDKLIVLNNVDVDEQAIKNLNKDYDVRDVSWK